MGIVISPETAKTDRYSMFAKTEFKYKSPSVRIYPSFAP